MKRTVWLLTAMIILLGTPMGCGRTASSDSIDPDAVESDRVLIRYKSTLYMKYQKVTADEKYLEDYVSGHELQEAGVTEKELSGTVPAEDLSANLLPKGTKLYWQESTRFLYYEDADGCLVACCAVSMMDGRVLEPTGSPLGDERYAVRYQGKNYYTYGERQSKQEIGEYCTGLGAEPVGKTVQQTYYASELREELSALNLPLGTEVWYLEPEDCLYVEIPDWGVIKLTAE